MYVLSLHSFHYLVIKNIQGQLLATILPLLQTLLFTILLFLFSQKYYPFVLKRGIFKSDKFGI